jgi:hypothetical protein
MLSNTCANLQNNAKSLKLMGGLFFNAGAALSACGLVH